MDLIDRNKLVVQLCEYGLRSAFHGSKSEDETINKVIKLIEAQPQVRLMEHLRKEIISDDAK